MKPYKFIKEITRNYILKQKLLRLKNSFDTDLITASSFNVLIIDSIIPEFNKDSGSRRLYELIKLMKKNGIGVFLMADKKEYKYKSDYIKTYRDLGVLVYEPFLDKNNKLVTKLDFLKLVVPHIQYAWLHRPDVFNKYHQIVKKHNSNCQLVYDMVDFHYLRLIREWEQNKIQKLKSDAEKHLLIEIENCKNADHIIVISQTDKESLKPHYNEVSKMKVIGNIHQFVKKIEDFLPFSKRKQLLFVGGFRHLPNIDAVHFLHNDIMPLVWKTHPEIEVVIVGSYPTPEILALNSDKFIIKGFVDEISDCYKTAKLFVAPLRFGAGIKGKIGQSFEYSLPVITTDVGAEGFDFKPYDSVMIGNSAEAIATKIVAMCTDETMWNKVSDHSETIISPFSIEHIEAQLLDVLGRKNKDL